MRKLLSLLIVTAAVVSLGTTCAPTPPTDGSTTVTLAKSGATMAEAAGTVTITANLSAAAAADVTVNLGFTGTAALTSHYTATASQIVIPAGSTSGTITLTAVEDSAVDADETVIVTITAATNATLGATLSQTVTITDNDGGAAATLNIVKTSIPLRFDAKLRCGTDLIAFGTGTLTGVSYVVPSTNPTAGTPVPDGANYNSKAFAVGGKNIFLAHTNSIPTMFQVSVFNTVTAATHTFSNADIRLRSIPVGQSDPGHIRADGNYCVVVCGASDVADGKVVKVIDASTTPPSLIAFAVNPSANVQQVDVDAATKRVVAATTDTLFIYNIDTPAVAPVELPIPNEIDATQMEIAGDYLIAFTYDASNDRTAILVNLAATPPQIINLTAATANFGMAIGGTKFAFFADFDASDSIGGTQRAAVGTIPGPGFDKAPLGNRIDGSTTNNGTVGFASTMCIVPGGTYQNYVFLAGGWYLQYSSGNASFTVPDDPQGIDPYATPAWDIDCSSTVVGFKTSGARTDAESLRTLGYIKLQ